MDDPCDARVPADALALEVARLREENACLRRRRETLTQEAGERLARAEAIREIGRALSAELDLDRFLPTAWRHLTRAVDAEDCWLGHWDAVREEMHFLLYVAGGERRPDSEQRLPLLAGQGLACALIAQRATIRVPDYAAECRRRGLEPAGPLAERPGNAWLGVPLVAAGRAVGALAVWRFDRPFSADDAATLETLSGHVGAALENARLYAAACDLAATDPLTGLANRRQLQERLEGEGARAMRAGHQLAAVLLDLDDFKAYNDAHGHVAGDARLRAIAQALRCVARAGDVAGRYGGDEFLLLLPETDRAGALALVERARAALPQAARLSAGVAVYPIDTPRLDELIEAADQALYRDKSRRSRPGAGRGRAAV